MCPDCGQWDFKRVEAGPCFGGLKSPYDQCQFCGWIGQADELGSKMLTREMLLQLAFDRDMKQQGKLFFVRAYLKNGAPDDADFEVIEILGAGGSSSSYSAGIAGFKIRLDSKPSDDFLTKARAVKGIERIEVW